MGFASVPKQNVTGSRVNASVPKQNVTGSRVNASVPKQNATGSRVNASVPKQNVTGSRVNASAVSVYSKAQWKPSAVLCGAVTGRTGRAVSFCKLQEHWSHVPGLCSLWVPSRPLAASLRLYACRIEDHSQ
jgi:hypothetical protein